MAAALATLTCDGNNNDSSKTSIEKIITLYTNNFKTRIILITVLLLLFEFYCFELGSCLPAPVLNLLNGNDLFHTFTCIIS